jgi:cytochrome c biogenesis protein CcdA
MESLDRSRDRTAAIVLAALVFLVFAGLVVGIVTDTFRFDDRAVAWVGAGIVGLACAVFTAWAVVLHVDARLEWADRLGGDLLLVGVAVGLVFVGLPTFAAGVL